MPSSVLFQGKRSVCGNQWIHKQQDDRLSLALSQSYHIPPSIAQLLSGRHLSLEGVKPFLTPTLKTLMPDPSHLKDLDRGVDRVVQALLHKDPIAIFADYDVDGATSSALLKRYFRSLGVSTPVYIPQREEGYGPNLLALQRLYHQGARVLILLDCGTTAFETLAQATEMGLDIVVIDHHLSQAKLPDVYALINPNRMDEESSLGSLCTAGLAFLFVVALQRALRQKNLLSHFCVEEPDVRSLLDLVALGTVCDVMPLTGLNRAFVHQGLKVLHKRNNLGLRFLADLSGLTEAPSAYHLGFLFGPRINAGGRIGDATFGSRLLSTEDPVDAQYLADRLNQWNKERQEQEHQITLEAIHQVEQWSALPPVLVVHSDQWHPGLIGIVAGRLKEKFNRPTCVICFSGEEGKGSGRSLPGINLGAALHQAEQQGLLQQGGGHAMAVGFRLTRTQLEPFVEFLTKRFAPMVQNLDPHIELEGVFSVSGLTGDFLQGLTLLEPYGQGNPTPRFAIRGRQIQGVQTVGLDHLKGVLEGHDGSLIKIMAFRALNTPLGKALLACQNRGESLLLAGTVKLGEWRGQQEKVIYIEDLMIE